MPNTFRGMLVSFTETDPEDEAESNDWFNREHIDERSTTPGFTRARRYVAVEGAPKYFATYETETGSVLASPEYLRVVSNQTEWSRRVIPKFTVLERYTLSLSVDQLHGIGGAVAVVRLSPPEGSDARGALRAWIAGNVVPEVIKLPGVIGACLGENMLEAVNATGDAARAIGGRQVRAEAEEWLVLFEGVAPGPVKIAAEGLAQGIGAYGVDQAVVSGIYRFLYGYYPA